MDLKKTQIVFIMEEYLKKESSIHYIDIAL